MIVVVLAVAGAAALLIVAGSVAVARVTGATAAEQLEVAAGAVGFATGIVAGLGWRRRRRAGAPAGPARIDPPAEVEAIARPRVRRVPVPAEPRPAPE